MKSFKFLFFVLALCLATSTNAQFSRGGSFGEKSHYFVVDVRFGGIEWWGAGFGVNLGGEKRFNDYIAWDYINIEYAAPFDSPKHLNILSAKTGVRGFTPSFANEKLRFYSNLAVGYTCILEKWGSLYTDHGFGLTFGVGLQINKKYSLGYALQYETAGGSKNHFGTFGIAF